ncbi:MULTISPECIES: hypothetical protein [Burkholderia]|uniref:hypothetical protein n=1 Tax=Burkholderia TaxID=32008 RepID=UPI0009B06756|nr:MULTISPECIES: hypothetical protein [Burkholderia]MBJ9590325.1 hypothetical protein [Burkholderia seminalis]MBN3737384.1 hypothetical protein [Burkholderia sp. Tr-20355]MCA8039855.1 hypothetical protein [Burkholderia seminalis]MCA8300269.1 hypothetical protein [Burkholderia seminalis]MCA8422827.1 hypothetical protein [Burkholderia seminalis]
MKPTRTESAASHDLLPVRSRRTCPDDDLVLLSIRVESDNLAAVRRRLHRAVGAALNFYTAVIDRRTGRACIEFEVARSQASPAILSILRELPAAEFGTIRLLQH